MLALPRPLDSPSSARLPAVAAPAAALRSVTAVAAAALLLAATAATAAPRRPAADAEVVERLPARATDPQLRRIAELRRSVAADRQNASVAVALADAYYAQVAAEGDPRYIGYAEAALAPWWDAPSPPQPVRVMRAVLRQFNHAFDAARADLEAAVRQDPADGSAWSWLAAIAMVQARYADARTACDHMQPLASALIAVACRAQIDAVSGRAAAAARALHAGLAAAPDAAPSERLWALTRLAETEERLGHDAAAEEAFRAARATGIDDGYVLAAYADFLLDRGRPADVLTLLQGRERSDLLLLRLALAAKAAGAPRRAAWQADLGARFDAARLRGDSVHDKEESRYALALLGDAERAVQLAARNYAVQREPADARALLEAALAARQPQAAEPALRWLRENRVESVVLQALASRLAAGG